MFDAPTQRFSWAPDDTVLDGSILVEYTLSSPLISKPVVSDFTDDSSDDITYCIPGLLQ